MRRTQILLAAATVAALAVSACSSAKTSASTTRDTASHDTAPPDTAPLDTAPLDTTPLDTAPLDTTPLVATGAHANEPSCQLVTALNANDSPFSSSSSTAADFQKFFTNVVTPSIAASRANPPASLKAQAATVAAGMEKLGTLLAANGWDFNTASTVPEVQTLLNDTAFNNAGDALNQYCGLGGS